MCTTPRSRADHRVVLNPIHGLLQAAERVEVETDVTMDAWIQALQELVDQGRGTRGIQQLSDRDPVLRHHAGSDGRNERSRWPSALYDIRLAHTH